MRNIETGPTNPPEEKPEENPRIKVLRKLAEKEGQAGVEARVILRKMGLITKEDQAVLDYLAVLEKKAGIDKKEEEKKFNQKPPRFAGRFFD